MAGLLLRIFAWDVLNRMTQHTLTSGAVVSYEYRADGMRTRKLAVGTGQQEILYLHDGQNPVEEATFSNGPTRGAYTEIVRNGLGARGIDYVEVFKTGSATSVRFPVYDGHGNMTACLLRDGAGGFTLTSRRAYDPWGAMRQWGTHPSGASAYQGAPSNRYVGSLGHQQDDDSGLYYMRARYYEPGSGRFISEDPAMHGSNWFVYCDNDPVSGVDVRGKSPKDNKNSQVNAATWNVTEYLMLAAEIAILINLARTDKVVLAHTISYVAFLITWFVGEISYEFIHGQQPLYVTMVTGAMCTLTGTWAMGTLAEGFLGCNPAAKVVGLRAAYCDFLALFLTLDAIQAGVGP